MSSTNKTTNLNLHSWVRTDPVVCEDFNENFNKIDEVVGSLDASRGNCEIYSGSYTGTGTKVHSMTFPKLPVFISIQVGNMGGMFKSCFVFEGARFNGPRTDYHDILSVSGSTITFNESGSGDSVTLNSTSSTYYYVAFAPAQ